MGVVVHCGEEGTVKRKSDDTELRRANITLLDTGSGPSLPHACLLYPSPKLSHNQLPSLIAIMSA